MDQALTKLRSGAGDAGGGTDGAGVAGALFLCGECGGAVGGGVLPSRQLILSAGGARVGDFDNAGAGDADAEGNAV